jgi:hypothetical protein
MTSVAKQELEDLSESITTCNVVYMPQVATFFFSLLKNPPANR